MTSFRQTEANRRNAGKSTGPQTEEGKQRSRCNAIRHGLTAETVVCALEDAADYKAFEAAIAADYDAQSAVERELVLRLASLLWRIRRATSIETGLFEIQANHLAEFRKQEHLDPQARHIVHALFGQNAVQSRAVPPSLATSEAKAAHLPDPTADRANCAPVELARCFLRLANLPNFALDRLNRYEATLWRQLGQALFMLNALDRHKPQERRSRARSIE
jgi:hypothetical protein